MRPKVKRVIREAQVLSGAKARYISLVSEGANETPFIEIKSKTGEKSMAIKQRNKAVAAARAAVGKSHKPLTAAKKGEKKAPVEKAIAKFEYSTAKFKTEKSVRDHLAKSDWEGDVTVIKKGNLWIVTPDDVDEEDLVKVAKVATGDDGVSAFIGIKKAAKAGPDDEEEDAEGNDDGEDENAEVEQKTGDDEEDAEEDDDSEAEGDEEEDGDDAEAEEDADEDGETEEKAKKPAKGKPADNADTTNGTKKAKGTEKKGKQVPLSKRALALKNAKSRQTERKFSFWDAYNSGSDVFKDVLKKGMEDGVPPGVDELIYCMTTTVRNTLASDQTTAEKRASLTKSAAAFSDTVSALDELFDTLVNATDVSKVVKSGEAEVAEKFIEKYADFLITEEAEEPEPVAKSKGSKKTERKSNGDAFEGLADLIAKAIKPISDKVEKIASAHPTSKAKSVEEGENTNESRQSLRKKRVDEDNDYIAKKTERGIFGS